MCLTSGSAGTLGCGDFLKERYPNVKLAVGEAVQCPTLLNNGYGGHRIEGIGDKHVPWIHNVKNTDMVIGVDDSDSLRMFRLFNEPEGRRYLEELGVSGVANLICCLKLAKYYELTENDLVLTVLTDSASMYGSRLQEMEQERGRKYSSTDAAVDHAVSLLGLRTDYVEELTYYGKKRIHNLKYYTWIEQQGYRQEELDAQWYDYDGYWGRLHRMGPELDRLIIRFNAMVEQ